MGDVSKTLEISESIVYRNHSIDFPRMNGFWLKSSGLEFDVVGTNRILIFFGSIELKGQTWINFGCYTLVSQKL